MQPDRDSHRHVRSAGVGELTGFEERLLAELQATVRDKHPAGVPGRRRGHGLRLAVAVSAACVVAIAAVALGSRRASAPSGSAARAASLVAFLDRAAWAAKSAPVTLPEPGQVFYQELQRANRGRYGARCIVTWYSTPLTGAAAFPSYVAPATRSAGSPCPAGPPSNPPAPYARPTHGYPAPASLPASAAALLRSLNRAAEAGVSYWGANVVLDGGGFVAFSGFTHEAVVFILIERLLQVPIRAALRAGLYHALALMHGVHLVRHATDVAGRAGIGIRLLVNTTDIDSTIQIVIDPATYRFMGLAYELGPAIFNPASPTYRGQIGYAVVRSGLVTPTKSRR